MTNMIVHRSSLLNKYKVYKLDSLLDGKVDRKKYSQIVGLLDR